MYAPIQLLVDGSGYVEQGDTKIYLSKQMLHCVYCVELAVRGIDPAGIHAVHSISRRDIRTAEYVIQRQYLIYFTAIALLQLVITIGVVTWFYPS